MVFFFFFNDNSISTVSPKTIVDGFVQDKRGRCHCDKKHLSYCPYDAKYLTETKKIQFQMTKLGLNDIIHPDAWKIWIFKN